MSAPPETPHSPSELCDVWSVDLGASAAASARLDVLSEAELARAARLRVERDRQRFATCRAALRVILGRYLQTDPALLVFDTGEHGRPHLGELPLDFNVSHSADLALIIVGARGPLGVDLEALREVKESVELAARYFHTEESQIVETAPAQEQNRLFLTCWTRKEAVLKSIGVGLTLDPRRIKVGASLDEHSMKLSWRQARHQVRIRSFEPADGYVAACVTPSSIRQIQFRRFDAAAE